MLAKLEYVSVGCSRTPHAADWSSNGLLAYAASNSVAIAKETEEGSGPIRVFATLHGYSGRVNCVRWLPPPSSSSSSPLPTTELLSGGVDGKVIVWRNIQGDEFSIVQELASHTAAVTCVTGVCLSPSNGESPPIRTLVASASGDSTVNIWERPCIDGQFLLIQTISFGRGFAFSVDFHVPLDTTEPLLVCGCDDGKVNLFVWKDKKFSVSLSLSGHTDWVRDVRVMREVESGDCLLASCSQDTSIRLWRISQQQQQQLEGEREMEGEGEGEKEGEGEREGELRLKGNTFSFESGVVFTVTLESILMGHEDWVYSVCWYCLPDSRRKTDQSDCTADRRMQLLSSSMDKTLIVWKPDPVSGVWMEEVRVGEVGGNTLGFYGGLISPSGLLIFAHDYQGGFHLWGNTGRSERESSNVEKLKSEGEHQVADVWTSLPTIGGHFAAVQGLSWEPQGGAFLLSVSSDQTARLHAKWQKEGVWSEIARPQIHGYDMTCVAMTTSLQYISGADEKVLRVFEAPTNFVANLSRISNEHLHKEGEIPIGASVPSLGLSNKAVFTCSKESQEKRVTKNPFADHIPSFQPVDLSEPPVEAHLLQNTLWPETQKLYGHGYEIYCVAASPDGCYVATACKATKAEHAVIRFWEVASWKQLSPPLHHHTLTITYLTFSHSSHLLLATSRDRCWSLWKRTDTNNSPFQLCASLDKTSRHHSRVIWTASWSHDDSCFVTGSRDKKVLLWQQGSGGGDCGEGWAVRSPPLECSHAVTALDFAPCPSPAGRYILAVGLESGLIHIHYCSLDPLEWNLALSLNASLCHTATVKQLSWKPLKNTDAEQLQLEHITLASCSHDNSVKVFRIIFGD